MCFVCLEGTTFGEGTYNGGEFVGNKLYTVLTRERAEREAREPALGARSIHTRWPKYLNYSQREQGGSEEITSEEGYYNIFILWGEEK